MREIKFRAKRIDMDRWVYGQYFTTPLTDENSGTKPDAGWFFLCGEKRHCIVQNSVAFVIDLNTLGQYTGLKDKNGKEIYEGDIVDQHRDQCVIKRCIGGFDCKIIKGASKGSTFVFSFLHSPSCEVIGNIYESPSEVTP